MQQLLLLAFLLPIPLFRSTGERTNQAAWEQLVAEFNLRGVVVSSDHPRCQEPNLYGLYVRGSQTVVVCNRGDRSTTLRHEGWHLVQSLCLEGRAWLQTDAIERGLNTNDRAELQTLVQPERWQREAEARVMAKRSVSDYLQAMNEACRARLVRQPSEAG
ncbi:MAG: hypothetical protein KXJ49_09565 [Vulcanococcus sp.]|uniref:hypothetical protein n=1 Tax=Vulcanococcus sp. TaxID=2856995 RepID=UPI0025D39DA7|nr:hypothetical protein [Vulcanococcus sp.]MBW0167734.1 hypothetical protein [Vulcanococcus sp.]